MNLTAGEGALLAQSLEEVARHLRGRVEVALAPPFTALQSVSSAITLDKLPLTLAAQNMHWEAAGAFTGEIAPPMLANLRVHYVILGHSERREYFAETDEIIKRKVEAAYRHGLVPILCCGESEKLRESGQALDFVAGQLRSALAGLNFENLSSLVVAYEPIWAIGTGKTATPAMAQEVCAHLRKTLADLFGEKTAARVRILYGGSVTGENAALFFAEPDIDGALVGGAALKLASFSPIIRAADRSRGVSPEADGDW
jgi:triosephosphate isomerase